MATKSRIKRLAAPDGVEAVEARFLRHRFAPHQHDTYTIGMTTAGLQRFAYRGTCRDAAPGDVFILHPGETHDGWPGTEAGYAYRALYLDPAWISAALDGSPLPFVEDPVRRDPAMGRVVAALLASDPVGHDPFAFAGGLADLAQTLVRLAGEPVAVQPVVDRALLDRMRQRIAETAVDGTSLSALERDLGVSRYRLIRDFKRCYGVTPHRFAIQRRLAVAKDLIRAGTTLAEAAAAAGFADQSHFSHHFRRNVGMPPGQWRALLE